jgi:hypothetical protein
MFAMLKTYFYIYKLVSIFRNFSVAEEGREQKGIIFNPASAIFIRQMT